MNRLFSFCLLLVSFAVHAKSLPVSSKIFENRDLPFKPNQTYLTMDIQFDAVEKMRVKIEEKYKLKLRHRGEAHITVITPDEYKQLKKYVSMEEINELAQKENIQDTRFQVVCLGEAQKFYGKRKDSTYFLVVNSNGLLNLRKKIGELFVSRGGWRSSFKAIHYFPHITVGFTRQDMHAKDGVVKDASNCISDIVISQ